MCTLLRTTSMQLGMCFFPTSALIMQALVILLAALNTLHQSVHLQTLTCTARTACHNSRKTLTCPNASAMFAASFSLIPTDEGSKPSRDSALHRQHNGSAHTHSTQVTASPTCTDTDSAHSADRHTQAVHTQRTHAQLTGFRVEVAFGLNLGNAVLKDPGTLKFWNVQQPCPTCRVSGTPTGL